MKCAYCEANCNDGVQCGACKKHLGFCCANITEQGYRRLGPDRRAHWKCANCKKTASPIPQLLSPQPNSPDAVETVTLEKLMHEITYIKQYITSFPTLVQDVKVIKEEMTEIKAAYDFFGNRIDEFDKRMGSVEVKISEVMNLESKISSIEQELLAVKDSLNSKDQWMRLNNIEIKGIPFKKTENLFDVLESVGKLVNYPIAKTNINYISRVPIQNSQEKSIVVNFSNRYIKEDLIALLRGRKNISSKDLGFQDDHRVFVNDHLTPDQKKLLTKTKMNLKPKGYQYIWVKFSKIHVRRNDNSKVFIVNSLTDLNKLL